MKWFDRKYLFYVVWKFYKNNECVCDCLRFTGKENDLILKYWIEHVFVTSYAAHEVNNIHFTVYFFFFYYHLLNVFLGSEYIFQKLYRILYTEGRGTKIRERKNIQNINIYLHAQNTKNTKSQQEIAYSCECAEGDDEACISSISLNGWFYYTIVGILI